MIFLNKHLFPRIFDALARREGQEVTLPTLESLTGFEASQIQGSINNARKSSPDHATRIEVVKPGRVWKFNAVPGANGIDTIENIVKEVDMGTPHIWKHVAKVLVDNPGEILSKEFIAEQVTAAGEIELSADRIPSAMSTIMRKPEFLPDIEVVWAGRSWRYTGAKKRAKRATVVANGGHEPVSTSIRASVLRYFNNRPGDIIFADEISQDLGFTRKQVQSAVYSITDPSSLIRDDFEVIQGGQSWRYTPHRSAVNGQVSTPLQKAPATAHALAAKPSLAVPFTQPSVTAVAPAPLPASPKAAPTVATTAPAVQAYTPDAVTTTLPVTSQVPNIPPATAPEGRLFEEIGQLADGALILREAESKAVYRATEL